MRSVKAREGHDGQLRCRPFARFASFHVVRVLIAAPVGVWYTVARTDDCQAREE